MTTVQARKRFSEWVTEVGGQPEAARILGCSKAGVCYWVSGKRTPLFLVDSIERMVGIPSSAWFEDRPVRARASIRRRKKNPERVVFGRAVNKR